MADLIAPQINPSVIIPQGMGINPWFDWEVILGVPFWVLIDCILLFAIAAVFVYWLAKLRKLNAVSGWSESLKTMGAGDVQVCIITRTQKLIIDCMKIEDNVLSYHDKAKIGMWHHNTRESVIVVGGNPALVVSEDYDQTRDLISEIVLTDNCDEFNHNQEDLQKAEDKSYEERLAEAKKNNVDPKTVTKRIIVQPINNYIDYESYGRELLQLANPDGLTMKTYNIFSNIRFLKYFPLGCSHMFFGGELTFDARNLALHKKEKSFWEKYMFLGASVIVVVIAFLAVWMVPLG